MTSHFSISTDLHKPRTSRHFSIFSISREPETVSRALYNREGHHQSVQWDKEIPPKVSIAYSTKDLTKVRMRNVNFDIPLNEVNRFRHSSTSYVTLDDVMEKLNKGRQNGNIGISATGILNPHMMEPLASIEGTMKQRNQSKLCTLNSVNDLKKQISDHSKADTSPSNVNSLHKTVGKSASFYDNDLWPWPWIRPGSRKSSDYIGCSTDTLTFKQDDHLPHAQIPLLALTLKGYLDSVKPCVTRDMFANTKRLTEKFALGCGKKYNAAFQSRVEDEKNWQIKALPNYMNTFSRQQLPIQNIPIIAPMLRDLWPPLEGSQIERAALLVSMSLDFFRMIYTETLQPLKTEDGNERCMHSFKKLFSSYRIPGIPEDGIASFFQTRNSNMPTSKHIVIVYRGSLYDLTVFDDNFNQISMEELSKKIYNIITFENTNDYSSRVGALTSTPRHVWCRVRQMLIDISEDNITYLHRIERAIFVLSLDHTESTESNIVNESIFADAANRWYDHALNIYIHSNGLITCNINNAITQGFAAAAMIDYIHLRILENKNTWDDEVLEKAQSRNTSGQFLSKSRNLSRLYLASSGSKTNQLSRNASGTAAIPNTNCCATVGDCVHLDFVINDDIDQYIEQSLSDFYTLSETLSSATCLSMKFKEEVLEKRDVHLDALAHMIVHLTHYRMYFTLASVGTSVPLSALYNGRYELMRATTNEAFAWCKLMLSEEASMSEKIQAYRTAEKKHISVRRLSMDGKGVSNHLTALKLVAEDMEHYTPELFTDEAFYKSGGDEMFKILMKSFGSGYLAEPVVLPQHKAGYGVGYTVVPSRVTYTVTSWTDEHSTSAALMAASLRHTMDVYLDFFHSL